MYLLRLQLSQWLMGVRISQVAQYVFESLPSLAGVLRKGDNIVNQSNGKRIKVRETHCCCCCFCFCCCCAVFKQ